MDNITYPAWYLSSTGPALSQTIFNLVGGFLPVINMALASHNINILPESVNSYLSLAVFFWFSLRAAYGYIRARKVLAAKIQTLQSENRHLIARVGVMPDASGRA